jgi:hypothetical protein
MTYVCQEFTFGLVGSFGSFRRFLGGRQFRCHARRMTSGLLSSKLMGTTHMQSSRC